mgnify:CR=1 FL=1
MTATPVTVLKLVDMQLTEGFVGALSTGLALFTGLMFNLLVLLFDKVEHPPSQEVLEKYFSKDTVAIQKHTAHREDYILNSASTLYVAILSSIGACIGLAPTYLKPQHGLTVLYIWSFFWLFYFLICLWRVLFNFMNLFSYESKIRGVTGQT